MKLNDVYKLYWKESYKKTQSPHKDWTHCFEGIGIVKEGREKKLYIHDNYWSTFSRGSVFYEEDIEKKLDIEYVGNLDDYDKIEHYDVGYYKEEDIMIITNQHGCLPSCISFYLKKGAEKDVETIHGKLLKKYEANEHAIKYAKNENKRILEKIKKLLSDGPEGIYL